MAFSTSARQRLRGFGTTATAPSNTTNASYPGIVTPTDSQAFADNMVQFCALYAVYFTPAVLIPANIGPAVIPASNGGMRGYTASYIAGTMDGNQIEYDFAKFWAALPQWGPVTAKTGPVIDVAMGTEFMSFLNRNTRTGPSFGVANTNLFISNWAKGTYQNGNGEAVGPLAMWNWAYNYQPSTPPAKGGSYVGIAGGVTPIPGGWDAFWAQLASLPPLVPGNAATTAAGGDATTDSPNWLVLGGVGAAALLALRAFRGRR